jgi:methionyl-tRNA synthetase
MAKKILITSALPYVGGEKHLGNLAGSILPADVHARFQRQLGREVVFLCGTDEHGTPAELSALRAGLPVTEYCARQHAAQAETYRRFGFSFDRFSRTSGAANRELTQDLYRRLDAAGLVAERETLQPWSEADGRFLQDRLVEGTCPHCGDRKARGDQCDSCGRLLDPSDLGSPRSALSGANVEFRPSRHLFLRIAPLAGRLRSWVESHPEWPPLVRGEALSWLDAGIEDRCITRDLSWGVPVPRPGFEGKSFYVWFDAPVGYVAAAVEWASEAPGRDWREWWEGGDSVRLVQFLGKDNLPFHTIFFPGAILGSGLPLKLADFVKGLSWLTFGRGKFSTSAGRGISAARALEAAPADCWRWWLSANAPEASDAEFALDRFAADCNKDLADVLGNLLNRVLSLVASRFGGAVPGEGSPGPAEDEAASRLDARLTALRDAHEAVQIRKAAAETRAIWVLGNEYLATQAPWSAATPPARAATAVRAATGLVRTAAVAAWPFVPDAAGRALEALGEPPGVPAFPRDARDALAAVPAGRPVSVPPPLFPKLASDALARDLGIAD